MWGVLILVNMITFISLTIAEDEPRHPYTYKYNVVDKDTNNNYEVEESGNPEIVRGSYRIALPDGRTQIVTYEVHPTKGYNAKVTYEGVAQYPDKPGYLASPYGPPEPINPQGNDRKYKRQSKQVVATKVVTSDEIFDTLQPTPAAARGARKVELTVRDKESKNDLLPASSEAIFSSKHSKDEKINIKKKHRKVAHDNSDSRHVPQPEPLSLQQARAPPTKKTSVKKSDNNKHAYEGTQKRKTAEEEIKDKQIEKKPLGTTERIVTISNSDEVLEDTNDDTSDVPTAETISSNRKVHEKIAISPYEKESSSGHETFTTQKQVAIETTVAPEVTTDISIDKQLAVTTVENPTTTIEKINTADIEPVEQQTTYTWRIVEPKNDPKNTDDIIEDVFLVENKNVVETNVDPQNTFLLDNTFYQTQFLEDNYRPFRAIATSDPTNQNIVNPYEYKLDENFFQLAAPFAKQNKNIQNVIEENGKKSNRIADITDDIFAENDLDSDYYEDYYSFPFGSRIPSVIHSSNDLQKLDDIPERAKTFNRSIIKASTIKPHGIIQKVRVPKDILLKKGEASHQPVPRGETLTFVEMTEGTFVPQYYTLSASESKSNQKLL